MRACKEDQRSQRESHQVRASERHEAATRSRDTQRAAQLGANRQRLSECDRQRSQDRFAHFVPVFFVFYL